MDDSGLAGLARNMSEECIAFRVRALGRVVTNIYDTALAPFGVTVNQATILIMLGVVGSVSAGGIGKTLIMEKSTVSRNLERMKAQGWIAGPDGGKGESLLSLSPAGKRLLVRIHPAWELAQTEVSDLLGDKGVAAIHGLHAAVRKAKPV